MAGEKAVLTALSGFPRGVSHTYSRETAAAEHSMVMHEVVRFNLCGFRLQGANCKVEGMGTRGGRPQSQCELGGKDGCQR